MFFSSPRPLEGEFNFFDEFNFFPVHLFSAKERKSKSISRTNTQAGGCSLAGTF